MKSLSPLTRRRAVAGLLVTVPTVLIASNAFADVDSDTNGGGNDDDDDDDTSGDRPDPDEPAPDPWTSNDDPLGILSRAPGFGDAMSPILLMATGSTNPPDYLGVEAGFYSSESASDSFQSDGKSFLDSVIDKLKDASAYLQEQSKDIIEYATKDWTVSTGTDAMAIGIVNVTPIWVLGQADQKGGASTTVGIGEEIGGFVSVSKDDGSWSGSVGAFGGLPGMAGMASIGISNGDVVVDLGTLVEAGASIEASKEYNISETVREMLEPVLAPLTDYRTFMDPLQYPLR